MKYWPLILLSTVFVVAAAYAQTEFMVRCQDGYCIMREADLMQLQKIVNALVERINELQERGSCS